MCIFLFISKDQIINFLLNLDLKSDYFITFYFITIFFYFLSPLPITFILLLNGFLFKEYGFFISMIQIVLGSIIIKNLSNQLNSILQIDFDLKKIDIRKLSNNNYSIFLSRFIVPYFFHNIYYGLTKIDLKRFVFIIFIAEIPMTFAFNQIGKSLYEISSNFSISLYSLFTDINFYIPFLIIFAFFIITNYLYKKKK
jgi:uncharacterized membrane protein YdjX (TVP38/TMEM64 family)